MNKDHPQLDVLYISTMISPLVKIELSNSIITIEAAVAQIIGSYLCTYRKVYLAKKIDDS